MVLKDVAPFLSFSVKNTEQGPILKASYDGILQLEDSVHRRVF